MDPNLFHLDWDRTVEAVATVVILSVVVERALAILFESAIFRMRFDKQGVKELITFSFAFLLCWYWHFDFVSIVLLTEHTTFFGMVVSAAMIGGLSKVSVGLFGAILGKTSQQREPKLPKVKPRKTKRKLS